MLGCSVRTKLFKRMREHEHKILRYRHIFLTILCLNLYGPIDTAFACTLGGDNNCTSSSASETDLDASTTAVNARPRTTVGNPISLITGNKYQRETDFQIPGSRLAFHRHYNSRNTDFNFGFGQSWTSTFTANIKRLIGADEDTVLGYQIIQGDGRLLQFLSRHESHDGLTLYQGSRTSDGHVGVANPRIEPMSSRFDSPEQLETALQNTGPGTPAFNRITSNSNTPNRMTVIHQLPPGETYGSGVPAGGSNLVQLQSVTVKYERIDGVWHVASMYPS